MFSTAFSAVRVIMIFLLSSIYVVNYIEWLQLWLNHPYLYFWNKFHLVVMYYLFIYCWIQFGNKLLRIFCIHSHERNFSIVLLFVMSSSDSDIMVMPNS